MTNAPATPVEPEPVEPDDEPDTHEETDDDDAQPAVQVNVER